MPRALLLPLLSLAVATPVAAAQAEGLALRYDVFSGGTFAVAMEAELEIAPTAYRLGAALELGGMYAVVSDWDMQTSVSGAIAGDTLLPVQFHKQSEGGERWAEISYVAGTIAGARGNPSPDSEDTSTVPAEVKAAAIDPLSAAVRVLHQVARTGSCAASMAVYDGKSYFQVTSVDGGPAAAPDSRYGVYSGPALLCRVTIDDSTLYGRTDEELRVAEMWLAQPIAGSLYVPVRIETDSKFGAVRIHLSDFWSVSGETAVVE
jgi:hypothetical protein